MLDGRQGAAGGMAEGDQMGYAGGSGGSEMEPTPAPRRAVGGGGGTGGSARPANGGGAARGGFDKPLDDEIPF